MKTIALILLAATSGCTTLPRHHMGNRDVPAFAIPHLHLPSLEAYRY